MLIRQDDADSGDYESDGGGRRAEFQAYDQIDKALRSGVGLPFRQRMWNMTDNRHYAHVDCPGHIM